MVFMPLLYSVVSYEQRASLKATFLRFSVSFIMTNCDQFPDIIDYVHPELIFVILSVHHGRAVVFLRLA